MALYGKVLKIFDETSLLIGLGSADGVRRGDGFVVVEKGEEITDPETGESLGNFEYAKAELMAVDVQERVSVLKTGLEQEALRDIPLSSRMVRDSVRSERDAGSRARMSVAAGEMAGKHAISPVGKGDLVRRVE
jgi:hypothetical protein